MKQNTICLFLLTAIFLSESCSAEVNPEYFIAKRERRAKRRSEDVAMYAYPLVMMDVAQQIATYTQQANEYTAPINQFAHQKRLATPLDTLYDYPNADCLLSCAWLDLTKQPLVLHVPEIEKRFFLFELFDGWTNIVTSITPSITNSKAQDFMICGPDYNGKVPQNVVVVRSPTNMLYISGLTQSYGPDDYQALHAIQDQYAIIPLLNFGKPYSPPTVAALPSMNSSREPPKEQLNDMSAMAFYARFSNLLNANPPSTNDAPVLKAMKELGIKIGDTFHIDDTDAPTYRGLRQGLKIVKEAIRDDAESLYTDRFRWRMLLRNEPSFGTDYKKRSLFACLDLNAHLSKNILVISTDCDMQGTRLWGTKHYRLRISKELFSEVLGFWSLTLYTDGKNLALNPINRYAIHSFSDRLVKNTDGSCDIVLQHQPPEAHNTNWLPCPKGGFNLILRLYQPTAAAFKSNWFLPNIICRDPDE